MQINFRQGIISSQSLPKFLQKNENGNINFDASVKQTILTFADGSSNYLWYEPISIKDAWKIPTGHKCWLYWDISTEDATRTFGYTLYDPFSTDMPNNPYLNQMYFDLSDFKYKSWDGQYWRDVIRVISGIVDESGILTTQSSGTQINWYQSVNTDIIVYDFTKKPIKNYTETGYEFLNKFTIINFKNTNKDSFKYNRILNSNGVATENITKHYCVTWDEYNSLQLADPEKINNPAFALTERTVNTGEIVSLCTEGFVVNRTDWNWPNPPHTSLYVGTNGILTTEFDPTFSKSFQLVGYIVSPNTIYVNFNNQYSKYITDNNTSPTPFITPTITVSTSFTATPTPTPTITTTPMVQACGTISQNQVTPIGSSQLINILSQSADDDNLQIGPLPFDFYFNGVNYGHGLNGGIYVGSNSYITFGTGSNVYNAFSATNPGKAILIRSGDHSYQQLFQNSYSNNEAFILRYEGSAGTSGTIGSPTMVWEITFYANQKIQLVIGIMGTTGISGISNGTIFVDTSDYNPNTSYAISDNGGDTGQGLLWTAQLGSILCNSGITPIPSPTPTPTTSVSVTPYNNWGNTMYIKRLNSNGTSDSTFSTITMTSPSTVGIHKIYQTLDNKIYCSSNTATILAEGSPFNSLIRLNNDGTFDNTFSELFATSGYVNTLKQTIDGKIYIGGGWIGTDQTGHGLTTIGNGYTNLIRLNSDGTLDNTFTALLFGGTTFINKIIQTIDNKIYVSGIFATVNGVIRHGLIRLNSDGTLDNTFSIVPTNSSIDILQTIDGHIYYSDNTLLKRLNSDGTLDITFNAITMDKSVNIYQTSNSKIYLGRTGLNNFGGNTSYHSIIRLNFDGTLDTTFVDLDPTGNNIFVSDLIQTVDQKIYIPEIFNFQTGIHSMLRLNSDGTVDGVYVLSDSPSLDAVVQTSDGHIYYGVGF